MKKKFLSVIAVCFLFTAKAQLTKSNWLVGGSGSFSYTNDNSSISANLKSNSLTVSPNIGYFLIDKFSTGARISISTSKANYPAGPGYQNYFARNTFYSFGPFARYYLLNSENSYNILVATYYMHQLRKSSVSNVVSNQSANTYGFNVGPVIYFNSSVGIEFTIGYSSLKYSGFDGRNNTVSANIGFQIHLEKDQ